MSDAPAPRTQRAIDELADILLATERDGTGSHKPPALRAALVKTALVLARAGVELPPSVVELVGETAAEAGVMDGQPVSQMHALMSLHLETLLPPRVDMLIDRAMREAKDTGPAPVLRFASVVLALVSVGGQERKRDDARATPAGPLARFLLAKD